MGEAVLIIVSTALINNFVLVKFLGLCPLMGTSRRMDSAIGMSLATLVVLSLASGITYLLDRWVLIPNQLEYLRILGFILVIVMTVQLVRVLIERLHPLTYQRLGIYLPLITTNCAVLGVALLNTRNVESFGQSLIVGFGTGLGFALVLIVFASLRSKLEYAAIPSPVQGVPIALITAGIMSLAFSGFSGLAQ